MNSPERLSLQSADGAQLNLDALYQIAPSCFTEAADPRMCPSDEIDCFTLDQ